LTYSIVACDLAAGEWGVAVQSKFLAVGAAVPFAAAGVGAIATQALANVAYGPDGLELLRKGQSAEDVVAELTAADDGRDDRQLGIVDAEGAGATFTGSACLEWAGGLTGAGFAAQGNILVSEATVYALAETFLASAGSPLALRLLACLAAAQEAGGDRRGQQSASLLVVRAGGGYGGRSDRLVDLRVDEHPKPIAELERIYRMHDTLFGSTPRERWLAVDESLLAEIERRLAALGYRAGTTAEAFTSWADTENLEERIDGFERIDPVVLEQLRTGSTDEETT
jgi:uncharacterized Ntn-hydrolase superfamily protein